MASVETGASSLSPFRQELEKVRWSVQTCSSLPLSIGLCPVHSWGDGYCMVDARRDMHGRAEHLFLTMEVEWADPEIDPLDFGV